MTQFSDLKLDPKILKAIDEAGYTTPTPIQAGAIPPALEGRDVLGIAQTGTGKTASFTLPMITLLGRGRARARMPRSLVLCPTRELAAQVAENFDVYAKYTRLTKALLIGGVSMRDQEMLIDRGVDVLIATPGRLLDHFERGNLLLQGVQIMVVDEADRMLDMGFIPDIERIFQLTPFTRQTLFFSATMAPEIERITNTFLNNPERIEVARQATTSETITQKLIELTPTRKDQTAKQKRELLRALIDAEGPADQPGGLKNAIIFCNRKTEVDIVAKSLKAHGYDAAPIHGDLDQRQRTATLEGFRDGSLRFLIASDVAARGLDIPAVSHVFNFDLPSHAEDYVHRIGRTGRAGLRGTAISISTPADEKYLAAIENLVKHELPRAELPEGFSLSDAARSAPREPRESDRGSRSGRGGSRSRSRSRKDEGRDMGHDTKTQHDAPALPEAVEVTSDAAPIDLPESKMNGNGSRNGERGHGQRDQRTTRDDRPSERRDQRPQDRRDDRKDERRDRSRDRDRGPAVMGMGDHVPDFMLTSFRAALTTPIEAVAADAAKADPAPAEAEPATEAVVAAEKPAPKRRTRSRKPAKDDVAAAETPVVDTVLADSGPAGDEAGAAPEVAPEAEEKPKPKRATRSRKKKEPATPEAPADASAAPADKLPEEIEAERHPVPAAPRDSAGQEAPADTASDPEETDTKALSEPQPENTQG